jgi:hypothetical protein
VKSGAKEATAFLNDKENTVLTMIRMIIRYLFLYPDISQRGVKKAGL